MLVRTALLIVATFAAAACYSPPEFPDGVLGCSPQGDCPNGQFCASDNLCYDDGSGPNGSGDSRLASLEISVGSLTPEFDPAVTEYTVALGNGTGSVQFTAAVSAPDSSTISVQGSDTPSGTESAPQSLTFGSNAIDVVVTAGDESTTYSIAIDRGVAAGQSTYAKASNAEIFDGFGAPIAISGDTLVVGATGEDSDSVQSNNSDQQAGAVYVFVRNGGEWAQQAYVKASNPDANDSFGISVAIFDDTLVVGATGESSSSAGVGGDESDNSARSAGAVYVFRRSGSTWAQEAYIKASNPTDDPGGVENDRFGGSVAIWEDTIVVGARFEESSATGVDGNENDDSLAFSGAAYVFVRSGTSWSQQAYLKASNTESFDSFGSSVAIHGDLIAVSAPNEDSNALGVGGNDADNSSEDSGAVYTFVRSGTAWSPDAYIKASNTGADDRFGASVSVFADMLVVGAPNEQSSSQGVNGDGGNNLADDSGAAYVFRRTNDTWSEEAYLKGSNADSDDQFGTSVAAFDNAIIVGAVGEASLSPGPDSNQLDNGAELAGAGYLFAKNSEWSQRLYLKSSNPEGGSGGEGGDQFGGSVAIGPSAIAIGASGEGSASTGINGDQSDNSADFAGAVYVFE